MVLNNFYLTVSNLLLAAHICEPSAEARILVCFVLNINLKEFILHKDSIEVSEKNQKKILKLVKLRLKGFSISSIIKKKEFYGKEFFVDKNVLIPRPESELLIDIILKKVDKDKNLKILDVGTGSGILSIILSDYYKNSEIEAIDKSGKAIKIAKINSKMHKIDREKIFFKKKDLFKYKPKKMFDIIISNPPYIETTVVKELLDNKTISDPAISLDGGKDGVIFYRELKVFCDKYLKNNGFIIFEHGIGQREKILSFFSDKYELEYFEDYSNIDRIIVANKK